MCSPDLLPGRSGLGRNESLVMQALLALSEGGVCRATRRELEQLSGVTREKTFISVLLSLEVGGWVTVDRRNGQPSIYTVRTTGGITATTGDNAPGDIATTGNNAATGGNATTAVVAQELDLILDTTPVITGTIIDNDEIKFEEFWGTYPRRIGKGAARKAWATAVKKENPDTIIGNLRLNQPRCINRECAYNCKAHIPHPSTWLNQERWDDENHEPPAYNFEDSLEDAKNILQQLGIQT